MNHSNSYSQMYKVAIIGAGISGLSAARYLMHKSGITDIIILEATEKAGGRINTQNFGNGSSIIELGAQWIHGEQNELCQLVKLTDHRHNKTSWEGKGPFLLSSNGKEAESHVVNEVLGWIEDIIENVEQTFTIETFQKENKGEGSESGRNETSMGQFLFKKFLEYLETTYPNFDKNCDEYVQRLALFQWGMSFQRIDNSCMKMNDVSLYRWSEFRVSPGEHYNNFKRGAQSFVEDALIDGSDKDEHSSLRSKIQFDSPVKNIQWMESSGKCDHAKITVEGSEGSKIVLAESVIVTVSIAVLKSNLESLFTPKLPSTLEEAIKSTGLGPVTKIFLEWEEPWWPTNSKGYQLLWPNEFIDCCDGGKIEESNGVEKDIILRDTWFKSITGFDPVLDNPNVLLGWMGGPEAIYVEGLSDLEVGKRCQKLLKQFTGLPVPEPKAVAVSKWNTNKYFEGAYSFRSIEGDKVIGDICSILCEPVTVATPQGNKPVILLAGEALSKTHYSTLHGAYESGLTQAAKLLQYISSCNS